LFQAGFVAVPLAHFLSIWPQSYLSNLDHDFRFHTDTASVRLTWAAMGSGTSMVRICFITLVIAVFCTACVATYNDLDVSIPSAVVTFTKAYDAQNVSFGGGLQGLDFSSDGSCSTMKRAIALSWVTADSRSKNIEAGKRVTVLAFTSLYRAGAVVCPLGSCLENQICENGISFVPEQGHHYSVTQSAGIDAKSCPIHIVDDATKATPPSVQHDFHGYCPGI
jgi:hypothetical protein